MATGQDNSVLRHLRRAALLHEAGDLTDGQLLERFLAAREEAAFEVLVRRHGPMVLGVCRRVLSNAHDAEDAFQASFLVLIRKGTALLPRQTLGNWLYGVAYHTALKARAAGWKRRAKERQAAAMSKSETQAEDGAHDWLPLLDQELSRLPEKCREAVVLCDLQGKTREEAARLLGVPTGTLSGRLTTARRLLAQRLARRGVTLSGTALAAVLTPSITSAGVPPALLAATVKSAATMAAGAGVLSAEVAALMHRVLGSMLLAKLKLTTAVLLTVAALGASAGVVSYAAITAQADEPRLEQAARHASDQDAAATRFPGETGLLAPPSATGSKQVDRQPSDQERLQGLWIPIGSIVHGEKKDPADAKLQMWKLLFDRDKVTVPDDMICRYVLDPTTQPKQMDILGKDKRPMILAIYEFEGDKLKVSFKKSAGKPRDSYRPTDFDTAKNESVLLVLKRRNAP
jgi:RNA polymerase sigma factor (sigma-70 family)